MDPFNFTIVHGEGQIRKKERKRTKKKERKKEPFR